MKTKSIIMLLFVMCVQVAWGLDVPRLKGRVNDYSNTLTSEQVNTLEANLKAFEECTSNQIAILMMPSLDGENLEDFSIKVAESWKIGQKGKDNGIILLFFMEDHKDRIEVGYGLESVLTDAISKIILEKEVKPLFKSKHYYEGISIAVDKIALTIAGEYQKEIKQDEQNNKAIIFLLILALVVGLFGYLHWSISGILGAIGTPIIWISTFGNLGTGELIIAAILGAGGGLLAYGILSMVFGGGWTGSNFGDGIMFSGSGDSGDSFSGGGGDFGGGGASGDW